MISMMVGRTIENEFPERPNCVGDILMEVRSLNTRKLRNVSFKLRKGGNTWTGRPGWSRKN